MMMIKLLCNLNPLERKKNPPCVIFTPTSSSAPFRHWQILINRNVWEFIIITCCWYFFGGLTEIHHLHDNLQHHQHHHVNIISKERVGRRRRRRRKDNRKMNLIQSWVRSPLRTWIKFNLNPLRGITYPL